MTPARPVEDPAALAASLAAAPDDRALRGRLAERLDRLGRYDEALAVLEAGLAQAPDAADLLILRLLALRHAGRITAATEALEILAARHPAHPRLPELRGILAEAAGDAATALGHFAADAAAHPREPRRRLRWVRALRRHGAGAEALAALDAGLALTPDAADLLAERCGLLRLAGRLEEAEATLALLLRHHPAHPAAARLRGEMAEARGDDADAARHYAEALAAEPQDRVLRARLAERLDRLGRYDAALDCLEAGLALAPAASDLLILRLLTLRHAGRLVAAAEALATLADRHPTHPRLPELQGILAEAAGDERTALRLWAADAAAHPDSAPRRLRWVRALARAGAVDAALAGLEAGLERRPDLPEFLAEHVMLLRQGGRFAAADAAVARLAALHPAHPALPRLRAEPPPAEAPEDTAAAVAFHAEALAAHPRDRALRMRLVTLLRRVGRISEALALIDAAPATTPTDREARASCLFELGRWSAVERMLEDWPEPPGHATDPARLRVALHLASFRHDHRAALRLAETLLAEAGGHGHVAMLVAREAALCFEAGRAAAALRRVPTRPAGGGPLRLADGRFRSLIGHLVNELALRPEETAALAEASRRPGAEHARRAAALVRHTPETMGPALALLIGLARAGEGEAPSRTAPAASGRAIPRLLHQYWDAEVAPPDVRRMMEQARRMVPDYSYSRWSDASARAFLAECAAPEVLRAYRSAHHAAMRADLLRLAILYEKGGVFLDADDHCAGPIDALLPPGAALVFHQEDLGSIGNNFVAATPRHPIIS